MVGAMEHSNMRLLPTVLGPAPPPTSRHKETTPNAELHATPPRRVGTSFSPSSPRGESLWGPQSKWISRPAVARGRQPPAAPTAAIALTLCGCRNQETEYKLVDTAFPDYL